MFRFLSLLGAALFFQISARAAVLNFSGEPLKTIEASGQKIPVYATATLNVKGTPPPPVTKLALTGAGVRVKKVVLLKINAYSVASYVENPSIIQAAAPMDGLKRNRAKALHLTFLRDIDAAKIRDSFKESLETNGVDVSSPSIKKVFEKLTFDMKEKSTMTLVGYSKDAKTDVLIFEVPNGTFSVEGEGLGTTFWNIWFGKPVDGGIEDLRAELLPKGSF